MAEIWELYDENRNPTGEMLERGAVMPAGRYNLAAKVWVRDDAGRFLISQRHPDKPTFPLKWEATTGAVVAGEDTRTGARRELAEELGLELPAGKFILLKRERRDWEPDFLDTYFVRWNGSIDALKFQENEVADAKWVTWEELCALDEAGELHDVPDGYRSFFRHVPHVPAAITSMTMEDYDEVYALWLRTPGMGVNDHDDSPEGIARFLERNPGCCFVAKGGDGIIGAGLAGHDGRRGFLYHTAVDPEAQGKGIGLALVNASIEALRSQGISKAGIHVFSDNLSGNRFWEKYGFVVRNDVTYQSYKMIEMKETHTK